MIFYRVRIERHQTDEKENNVSHLPAAFFLFYLFWYFGFRHTTKLYMKEITHFQMDFGGMESLQPGVLQGLLAPCRCLLNLIGFAIAIGIFLVCVQSSQTLNRKQSINGGMTFCMYILSLINIGKLTLSFEGWGPDDWHMFQRASWCQQQRKAFQMPFFD